MPFDIALSGIRAASSDLSVTGNNIANAATTGFKSSRVEFGDVYANSVLGAGSTAIGSGVKVVDIAQNFTQGNVSFTENELDLAINGNGYFVFSDDGKEIYSRSGALGLDRDGFVTSNTGARLQGFSADESGNIGGIQGDVQVETSNLAPRATTAVDARLNLDSSDVVLQTAGRRFTSEGNAIGVTQVGLKQATTSQLAGANFTLPLANDFATTPMSFDIQMTGASENNGTVTVNLSTVTSVPSTLRTFNDVSTLAAAINAQLFSPSSPQVPVDVVATAEDNGGGLFSLNLSAVNGGESSQIQVSNLSANTVQLGFSEGLSSTIGIPEVDNGYPEQYLEIVDEQGNVVPYTSQAGYSAAKIASDLNAIQGVLASAETQASINNFVNTSGNMVFTLNGVDFTSDTLEELSTDINEISRTSLPGITASFDSLTGRVNINSAVGDDLVMSISSIDDEDSITVQGDPDAPQQTLEVDRGNGLSDPITVFESSQNQIIVGGNVTTTIPEDFSIQTVSPPSIGIFQPINDQTFTDVIINEFDPTDQATYNSATSMTVYDSLGNAHVLTQYFVKQDFEPLDPTTTPNHWVMFARIDDQDVGDPDTSLPPPENTLPTLASYNLFFHEDGSLDTVSSDSVLISNWTPVDDNNQLNGALGPQNVLAGGSSIIPDPPTSSNFVVDFGGTTQFGSPFSVNDVDQDGFATGRLSGLNVDRSGIIFARFTNGESKALGQVLLADFSNQDGLQPNGDTAWVENFQSGPPNIGVPGSASLGEIQSGALEESNVDLSEELVGLIVAQRNFQANAKTIETADQTTQTIINIR